MTLRLRVVFAFEHIHLLTMGVEVRVRGRSPLDDLLNAL